MQNKPIGPGGSSQGIIRIVDANINRLKEGLRVCEEITRFIIEDKKTTSQLKSLRHKVEKLIPGFINKKDLLKNRNSAQDIGKNILGNELSRAGVKDIFFANIQRVKESARVLEEFSKIKNRGSAIGFKKIRYAAYEIERKISKIS